MAADPLPQHAWRVVPTTAWTRATDGTAVVMDLASGVPLRLSATGSLIWEVLVEDRTPDDALADPPLTPLATRDLVAEVAAAVNERTETVEADVVAFLGLLAQGGILERLHEG